MVGLSGLPGFGIFGVEEDRVLSVAENGGTGVRRAALLSFLTSGSLVDKDKERLFDKSYIYRLLCPKMSGSVRVIPQTEIESVLGSWKISVLKHAEKSNRKS